MSVLVLVAAAALLVASATSAARGDEIKLKVDLVPCFPLGDGEAEGEAEWEQEPDGRAQTATVKVEIAGIPERAGEELDVIVEFLEGEVNEPIVVGSIYVAPDGRGLLKVVRSGADLDGSEEMRVVVGERPLFASDRDDCDRT
jgi:hypothetical protein